MPFDSTQFSPQSESETRERDLSILRAARIGVIHGWCQGDFHKVVQTGTTAQAQRCVLGWIGHHSTSDDMWRISRERLFPLLPEPFVENLRHRNGVAAPKYKDGQKVLASPVDCKGANGGEEVSFEEAAVYRYNDHPTMVQQKIVDLLTKAIRQLEMEHS